MVMDRSIDCASADFFSLDSVNDMARHGVSFFVAHGLHVAQD
jgi:hypothetical protein